MNWLTNFVLPKIRAVVAKKDVPDNLWTKCPNCDQMLFHRELESSLFVCRNCGHHLRLDAKRRLELLFDGQNPSMEAIDRNMQYLEQVLRSESWRLLRRQPPLHAADPDTLNRVRGLMVGYFKKAWLQE